ncbi:Rossmann-fold superfamily protein [Perilla frutescens var. frutescens]|nr:Rossmann-fold superfamily protein [Perilla frutescens var. frutescens]
MASASSTGSSLCSERLLGKVAVVTGGANGIGASIVRSFLRHGAKICVADIEDDTGHHLVESLSFEFNHHIFYCHCNVTVEEDVKRAVDAAVAKYGTVDIMVNNAGITGPFGADIRNVDISMFEQVFDVNVKGVFSGMKHAARVMIPKKKGTIISTCSVAGVMGGVGPHAYTGSKHAVVGLTKSAACELGQHGIRVNCVSPYGVVTGLSLSIVPHKKGTDEEKLAVAALRHGMAEKANLKGVELTANDVANAVVFLASDEANYISGVNLMVDGGFSAVYNSFRDLAQIE